MPSRRSRDVPVVADRRAFQDVEAAARFCTFRSTRIVAGGPRVSHDTRFVSHANLPGYSTLDLARENAQALAHAPIGLRAARGTEDRPRAAARSRDGRPPRGGAREPPAGSPTPH